MSRGNDSLQTVHYSNRTPILSAFYSINGHYTYMVFVRNLLVGKLSAWICQSGFYTFYLRCI